jgi:tellurite resistance protein TehA-like permease
MDAIRDLHPGYFAFVMATGIISTGTFLLGPSWLSRTLLVVASAGLAVLSVALVPAWPSQSGLLAPFATGLWSVGLVLYLLLVSLILLRWLTVAMTPQTLGPPYWILMGATAITVLVGAKILGLPGTLPVVRATAGFVEGFSYALWAFGTWWIPLLVVLGFWRHVRHHWPLTYEPTLWSVVFPLGMYSVASLSFGKAARLTFMEPLSRFMLWVAVAAWVLVAAAFLAQLARSARRT